MTTTHHPRETSRLTASLRLVLARYWRQVRRMPVMSAASLLLPAAADILNYYAPPLQREGTRWQAGFTWRGAAL